MRKLTIDLEYVIDMLQALLRIPSPSGYTDQIVHFAGEELTRLGIPFEITRRGAMRATLRGREHRPARALVAHLDTLGAMVKQLKENGRLEVAPIGSWSSRFAEGARVTVFTDQGARRGTLLPLKASGHTYNEEIDSQPVQWSQVELRVDERSSSRADLEALGFNVGDVVAIDPAPEVSPNGFINSRHLDDKAGVAVLFAVAKAVTEAKVELPVDCHLLFTISEEVGSGASAVLHGDIGALVAVDNATPAPGQSSSEFGVTLAMMDSSGPFDWHLTHKLIDLCQRFEIPHHRDVFRYYRCDAASALEAGNDIRTALACFGADASHGYERTHVDSLRALGELLALYVQTPRAVSRDRKDLGPIDGFPTQPMEPVAD